VIQVRIESVLRFSDRDIILQELDRQILVPAGSYRREIEELRRKSEEMAKNIAQETLLKDGPKISLVPKLRFTSQSAAPKMRPFSFRELFIVPIWKVSANQQFL
jgi:hypothetical protein